MSDGYIKLWRKSLDTGMIKSHNLWVFWTWCLLKASWQPMKIWVGLQEIELQSGQFIFGLKTASEETGLSIQKIRTSLVALENYKNLTRKVTSKFSVITICNWDVYQSSENGNNNQTNTELTRIQQSTNNKQEVKEGKKEEIHTLDSDESRGVVEGKVSKKKTSKSARVVQYTPLFEEFHSEYPRRVGKAAAFKAWMNIGTSQKELGITMRQIIDAVKAQDAAGLFDKSDKMKHCAHPATWLNDHRWEDEIPDPEDSIPESKRIYVSLPSGEEDVL